MRSLGFQAERYAAYYLRDQGYKILAQNFHSRFGEIDIIATERETLVFVEVKMRSSRVFGTPLEAITYSKLQKMQKTAYYFLTIRNYKDVPFRFDAIAIKLEKNQKIINHVKNITL